MMRFLPFLVALGLVAAVVVPYLALGGGRFEPTSVADPCEVREQPEADGLGETIERIALSAVDGVACELGVSREELVLALRSEEALVAFSDEQGLDRDEAIRAGAAVVLDSDIPPLDKLGVAQDVLDEVDRAEELGELPDVERAFEGRPDDDEWRALTNGLQEQLDRPVTSAFAGPFLLAAALTLCALVPVALLRRRSA